VQVLLGDSLTAQRSCAALLTSSAVWYNRKARQLIVSHKNTW
jgi:hypothetical protein